MDDEKMTRAYVTYWRNYRVVSKKSTRYDFGSVLFVSIMLVVIVLLIMFIGWMLQVMMLSVLCQWVLVVFGLVNVVPLITLSIRRLNDSGKSWAWIGGSLLPIINLVLVYLLFLPSEKKDRNRSIHRSKRKRVHSSRNRRRSSHQRVGGHERTD